MKSLNVVLLITILFLALACTGQPTSMPTESPPQPSTPAQVTTSTPISTTAPISDITPIPEPTAMCLPLDLAPPGLIRTVPGYEVSVVYSPPLAEPMDMIFSPSGDLFVIELALPRIRRVTLDGEVSTYTTLPGSYMAIAYDADGDLCVGGVGVGISKVSPDGILTTFADLSLTKMVLGPDGAFYTIYEGSPDVKKVTMDGQISTYASGLTSPKDLAFDPRGELYVSDPGARRIVKVDGNGELITVASGFWMAPGSISFDREGRLFYWGCWEGDEGWGELGLYTVSLSDGSVEPFAYGVHGGGGHDLEIDDFGNIFGLSPTLSIIFKISPEGEVEYITEGWYNNRGMAVGPSGDLFIADLSQTRGPHRIIRVGMDGSHSVFFNGIDFPLDLDFDESGNLFVSGGDKLLKITPEGEMSVVAEGLHQVQIAYDGVSGDIFGFQCLSFLGQPAKLFRITPEGNVSTIPAVFEKDVQSGSLAIDAEGNILLAVTYMDNYKIGPLSTALLKISPQGEITVLTEIIDYIDEWTHSFAVTPSGDIYLVDQPGNFPGLSQFVMWKITPQGKRSPFATCLPTDPFSVAINPEGDIFFSCGAGIYKISAVTNGIVVDGLKDDWQGYSPLLIDPEGDWEGLQTDIGALYGFTDDENMYLMVEFYELSDEGLDSLNIEIDIDDDGWTDYTCVFIPNEATVQVWDINGISWTRRGLLYTGNVAEMKMPLCYIGDRENFQISVVIIGETNGIYSIVDRTDWARLSKE
jgi:hypothetical protein